MLRLQEAYRSFLTIQVRLKGIEDHSKVHVESVRVLQSPPKDRMLTSGTGYIDHCLCSLYRSVCVSSLFQYLRRLVFKCLPTRCLVRVLFSSGNTTKKSSLWILICNWDLSSQPLKNEDNLVCILNSIMFLLSRCRGFSVSYQYDKNGK